MPGPLHGIRILDLSAIVSGPLATMWLGDQGADIIKIEPPFIGDLGRYVGPSVERIGALYASCNRNKRSLVIDFQKPGGIDLVKRLAADVDVVVENFRPGVVDRLGIGYKALQEINPGLVYASITGFGQDGPYAEQRVYDPIIQAVSALAASQASAATANEPQLIYSLVCDKVSALTAAQAITAALFARDRSPGRRGQHIQISMLDAAISFNWPDVMWNQTFLTAEVPPSPGLSSIYRIWRTKDGFITAAVLSDEEFRGYCRALGLEELIEDERYNTLPARVKNMRDLLPLWQERIAALTTADALERLQCEGVPAAIINSQNDVTDDPQVRHCGSIVETDHPKVGRLRQPRPAVQFAQTPASIARHAPDLGEHTRELLAEFGLDADTIDEMIGSGVVA